MAQAGFDNTVEQITWLFGNELRRRCRSQPNLVFSLVTPEPSLLMRKMTPVDVKTFRQADVKKWPRDDPRQVDWNERRILMFAKAYHPLSEVENPWFVETWLRFLPSLNIPSRREFRLTLIPQMVEKTLKVHTLPVLLNALVIALTYDLWMTYGTTNVFAVNAHVLQEGETGPWVRQIKTLGLVKISTGEGSTSGLHVSKSLEDVFKRYDKHVPPGQLKLSEKFIGGNSDGGTNLDVMRFEARSLLTCKLFPSLQVLFAELCAMHIMGGATKAAFDDKKVAATDIGVDLVDLHKRVTATLTWPRLLAKFGTKERLNTTCLRHYLWQPSLPGQLQRLNCMRGLRSIER